MADINRKLAMLAERGTRVGAEEMIERIEADLAADPLVVVSKQPKGISMTKTHERSAEKPPPSTGRNFGWAAAVFAAVLAIGALFVVLSGDEPTEDVANSPVVPSAEQTQMDTDLGFIQSTLDSHYGGDWETSMEVMSGAFPPGVQGSQALYIPEIKYQGEIGGTVEILDCTAVAEDRVYDCRVAYSNDLFEAVGEEAHVLEMQFRVLRDGYFQQFAQPLPVANPIRDRWFRFESESGLSSESTCLPWGSPSGCAEFQLSHLDEFAVWYAETYQN